MSEKKQLVESKGEDFFYNALKAASSLPGVKIHRNDFLRKEFSKYYDAETVNTIIEKNPASAGIHVSSLKKVAKSCIDFETNKVTAISAAAGLPGGWALAGTVPADVAQYFAHIIRVLQKLIYLYGWQDIFNEEEELDSGTMNQLTLFIGVMFGVNSANAAVTQIASTIAKELPKKLMRESLTKGTIYPIVKQIAKIVGVRMTKEIFAKSVGKIVPVLGALVSGGITYATFKPLTQRLQDHLVDLPLADINNYQAS